jgi:hypothetical protein
MKKYSVLILALMLFFYGCTKDNIVEPTGDTSYSGKYENLLYGDSSSEPNIVLHISQKNSAVSGDGTFNGINFTFTGTLIDNHLIICFDLLNTNVGDLKNCNIDAYFNASYYLAGGYTLTPALGYYTQKIRFQRSATSK